MWTQRSRESEHSEQILSSPQRQTRDILKGVSLRVEHSLKFGMQKYDLYVIIEKNNEYTCNKSEADLYNILFYDDEEGNKPVEDFIDVLDGAAHNNKNARVQLEQIIYCLNRLEDKGTRAGGSLQNGSQVIYGSCVLVITAYYSLAGTGITLFCYITLAKPLKRHLRGKLQLLKDEWRDGSLESGRSDRL
jgi:hypothetical protein